MVLHFDRNVRGIGALADRVRRELYRFVCSQPEPVSRDQAAAALGIARHQAKFHLDRLAADGLLDTDYVRLTGRTGPGAGRTAKRYRRGSCEFSVSLPERQYELAGQIMAGAICESAETGVPIGDALSRVAAAHGAAIGADIGMPSGAAAVDRALGRAVGLLAEHGYEPRCLADTVVLVNCPFQGLARRHPQLICQMNHALIAGLASGTGSGLIDVRLEPGQNRCCVTLTGKAG
jgi:predicted ArsR family transcriptional regulator